MTLPSLAKHEHIVHRLWFPFHNQYAVTLGPFGIWYRQGYCTTPIRLHEAYHWNQQRRWLYLPWYIAYLVLLLVEGVILRKPADELTMEREGYRIQAEAERREKDKEA